MILLFGVIHIRLYGSSQCGSICSRPAFNTEVFAKGTIGVNENDLTVSVPKLFFGYATGTNLLFPFAVGGATALFSERSTPEKLFEMIGRYRPTILTTVPTMINSMLNAMSKQLRGSEPHDYPSPLCYSAGEALPMSCTNAG